LALIVVIIIIFIIIIIIVVVVIVIVIVIIVIIIIDGIYMLNPTLLILITCSNRIIIKTNYAINIYAHMK